ncbi:hypothetical protein KIN20_002730 [Parelaphostrongylus tenuis]|uniref:Uncharacterized protein n=1 Tax=Parelaphostrongylus tenuis TaxID=148309 RepID=A0AAD5MNZ4_PARTN|nr:hypothetical protein KIN20_002730 [Parelaphostrongylus tenuis]
MRPALVSALQDGGPRVTIVEAFLKPSSHQAAAFVNIKNDDGSWCGSMICELTSGKIDVMCLENTNHIITTTAITI